MHASEAHQYTIDVAGWLDASWAAHFAGMSVRPQPDGRTRIVGIVVDQAALHGLIARVRDLGLPLIAVICQDCDRPR